MQHWFLYMIRSADNALYTGITTDLTRRLHAHQHGKGAKALRGKGELTMVFSRSLGERRLAQQAEYRIKQLTKQQKEQIVTGQLPFDELIADLKSRHSLTGSDAT